MPIFSLGPRPEFPEPERADPSGVLAVGGDLSVERLLTAYSLGIFPWPVEGYPLLWHAPPQVKKWLNPRLLHLFDHASGRWN